MTTPESGSMNRVSLRDVWPNETLDFTPWLANNLHLLGDATGMELSLIQTEASGWAGYLDMLAEATGKGKVAIENQIEPSDSDHFARLIGYAADHDARILIWVAPQFWEYHLRQVAWLNEVMAGNGSIHAVAARLVPGGGLRLVGSDETAPGFRAEFSQVDLDEDGPEWAVLKSGELSETDQRYRDFFWQLLSDLRGAAFTDRITIQAGQCQSFLSDHWEISYNAGFLWDTPVVFLWISAGDRGKSQEIYDALLSQYQAELKHKLPDLEFDVIGNLGGWRNVSLGMTQPGARITDSGEELGALTTWMSDAIIRLKAATEPRLQKVMAQFQTEETTE